MWNEAVAAFRTLINRKTNVPVTLNKIYFFVFAGRTSDTGVSKTTQQAANHNEGVYHSDLPQDQPTDHNLQPQTPGRAGPPLSVAGGISRTSGCKEEEDEEEEEVDILCFSPVKVQTTEDELHNVEIIPDEEEEEDANEIDVTGDEAE